MLSTFTAAAQVDRVFVAEELAPPSPGKKTSDIRWEWRASVNIPQPNDPAEAGPEWQSVMASGQDYS